MARTATQNPWLVVLYAIVMQAVTVGIGVYSFGFFVLPWMAEFQLERGTILLAITLSSLMGAVISPWCGALCDRLSSRTLVVLSSLFFAGGLSLVSVSSSYFVIIAAYALMLPVGVCLSGTLMALTLVGRLFNEKRGLAMGVVVLGTNVGGLALPVLVTLLLDQYSWQQVFQWLAMAVVVLVSLPALLVLRGGALQSSIEPVGKLQRASGSVMRSPAVLKLGVAYLVPCLLFVALLHNIGALAADLSIHQQQAAFITAAASVVMGVGKLSVGALTDYINDRILYLGCMALMAVGLVLVSFASTFIALLIGVSLTALVMGGTSPLVSTVVADRWGVAMIGRVMGVVHAFAGVSALGAFLAGYLRDVTGDYRQVFLYLLLAIIPAVYCMLTLGSKTVVSESAETVAP